MRGFGAGRVISVLLAIAILVLAVWFFSQDHQPPEIKSLGFKSRVAGGEAQEVFVVVVEKEPADSVFLRFNSSTVQVPLAQKYGNDTVVYSAGFDASTILAGEGLFRAELIVRDEAGNEARRSLEFLANLEAPLIKNASVEGGLGGLEFWVEIDEDNLKEAFVEYDGGKTVLTRVGAKYFARVEPGCALNYTVKAIDAFGLSSSLPVEAPLSEVSLYCSSLLFREIYSKDKSLASSILTIAKNNGSALPKNLAYQVLDQIERDNRVGDKIGVARNAFKILNDLEVNNLIHKSSICILGNYSEALNQGLPEHSASDIKRLIDAGEACEDIVDFEPVMIRDVTGNEIRIESKNFARDYWMIAELLKNRPEIAQQTKKFEWINRMMQQMAWKIFEDEYGPSYFDKKAYKPNEPEVWNVILGFHDYMDALPEKLVRDNIPIVLPYWDSEQLRQTIADKTNRTIALFYLAEVPARSFDKANCASKENEAWDLYNQGKIDRNTLGELLEKAHKESIISGIKGMEKFVEQLPKEYEERTARLNNANLRERSKISWDYWLIDRSNHGLMNTVAQYKELDSALSKLYPQWLLIRFIYGDVCATGEIYGGEWEMYTYGLPLAYKAFGIPLGQMGMRGTSGNLGGPGNYSHGEFAIYGIPQNVVNSLLSEKDLGRIAIAYGNGISMLSGIDGVEKDTGYQITHGIRRIEVYLWKK